MKKIFSFVFAAMMLLMSSSAMAQSETLKGDVNADGVVDVADIAAIIKIMQEAGGAVEEISYYWYVGQSNPAEMTSIEPIVTDNSSPGWRLIGTSVPSYSDTNMLWDGVTNNIAVDKESDARAQYFVAVPDNKIQIYNGLKGSEMSNYDTSEITIGGVKYYVYSYKSKGRTFMMNLY